MSHSITSRKYVPSKICPVEKVSIDNMSVENMSVENMSVENISVEKTSRCPGMAHLRKLSYPEPKHIRFVSAFFDERNE